MTGKIPGKFKEIITGDQSLKKLKQQTPAEWICCCPFHDDKSPSLSINVEKDVFICHGCGRKGDSVDWLIEHKKMSPSDAILEIYGKNKGYKKNKAVQDKTEWIYESAKGEVVAKVFRSTDHETGKKKYYQETARKTASGKTVFDKKGAPPMLYQLPLVVKSEFVLIVEGEKCADAFNAIRGKSGIVATTWKGGCAGVNLQAGVASAGAAVNKVGLKALKGKKVALWADNDEVGKIAMRTLGARLDDIAAEVRSVRIPEEAPDKWDIADAILEGWDLRIIVEHLKRSEVIVKTPPPKLTDKHVEEVERNPFFKILGKTNKLAVIQTAPLGEVYRFKYTEVYQQAAIFTIAPETYWEEFLSIDNKNGIGSKHLRLIGQAIQIQAARKGLFDDTRQCIEGRGMHEVGGVFYAHLGRRMMSLTDGYEFSIFEGLDNKAVFLEEPELSRIGEPVADATACTRLYDAVGGYRWQNPSDKEAFIGWLTVAMVAGSLKWRPHVWITGQTSVGKSWLRENIVEPLFGSWRVLSHETSTTAAISRSIGNSALPVIIDEAFLQGQYSEDKQRDIVSIMRHASQMGDTYRSKADPRSDTGITKVNPKSAFMLLSSRFPKLERADSNRLTAIHLKTTGLSHADFAELEKKIERAMTSAEGIRNRILWSAGEIRQWCDAGRKLAREHAVCGTRDADQIGTLAGGAAWMQTGGGEVQVGLLAAKIEIMLEKILANDLILTDSSSILDHILAAKITINIVEDGRHFNFTHSIGTWLSKWLSKQQEIDSFRVEEENDKEIRSALGDVGIMDFVYKKMDTSTGKQESYLVVSPTSTGLSMLLRSSSVGNENLYNALLQIKGIEECKVRKRGWGGQRPARSLKIPLTAFQYDFEKWFTQDKYKKDFSQYREEDIGDDEDREPGEEG